MNFYEEGADVTRKDASPLGPVGQRIARFSSRIYSISYSRRPIISEESEDATEDLIDPAKWFWLVGLVSRNCLELVAWKSGAEMVHSTLAATLRDHEML